MKKVTLSVIATAIGSLMFIGSIWGFAQGFNQSQASAVKSPPKPQTASIQPSTPAPKAHRPIPPTVQEQSLVNPQYVRFAKDIQWPGGEIAASGKNKEVRDAQARAKFEQWLNENEIQVFDEKDVSSYMDHQVEAANRKAEAACPDNQLGRGCLRTLYSWEWFPLSGKSGQHNEIRVNSGGMVWVTSNTNGYYDRAGTGIEDTDLADGKYRSDYVQPIPASALADAAAIKAAWPDAEFDVTAVDKHIDPFLSVRFPWGREIFAKWDEPNFGQ